MAGNEIAASVLADASLFVQRSASCIINITTPHRPAMFFLYCPSDSLRETCIQSNIDFPNGFWSIVFLACSIGVAHSGGREVQGLIELAFLGDAVHGKLSQNCIHSCGSDSSLESQFED